MDGTLLDGDGCLPAGLHEVLARMREHGVLFAPASGRQLGNLQELLGEIVAQGPVIAENGTIVADGPRVIYTNTMPAPAVRQAVLATRRLFEQGYAVGIVVSGVERAYVERRDERFMEQVRRFYASRQEVDDLLTIDLDNVVKAATFDFQDVERGSSQALMSAVTGVQVMAAGIHWTDMISYTASKGLALRALQEAHGITPAQTAVFGDYLNDLGLYDYADLSFAMENAHPGIQAVANYTAPANTDDGVLRTISELLRRTPPGVGPRPQGPGTGPAARRPRPHAAT